MAAKKSNGKAKKAKVVANPEKKNAIAKVNSVVNDAALKATKGNLSPLRKLRDTFDAMFDKVDLKHELTTSEVDRFEALSARIDAVLLALATADRDLRSLARRSRPRSARPAFGR